MSLLTLMALQTLLLVALLEHRVLLRFNGLVNWLTLLTLQTLRLVALLEQTGLLTFNSLISWLTLLALQTLRLVALLEQKCLLMFNGLTSSLTGLRWYKRDWLTLDKISWQRLDNGGKSCSFNEKEILD